ncbi:MAG TPA: hypothetical protein PLN26_15680 [Acidobacteriota bacterium]|nr:hypothetical protein [Acidobacteriota bacterium]HQF88661.1 hypothetical protein [Acidobacteriota bacterium]HQK87154.1 hypothetical protein [Acidobacteriota bacterium]
MELTGEAVTLKIIQPRADHGIRISGLDDRELVLATLSAWLGMDASAASAKAWSRPAPSENETLETPPPPRPAECPGSLKPRTCQRRQMSRPQHLNRHEPRGRGPVCKKVASRPHRRRL